MSTPFDTTGVTRGPDGIKRYDGLPDSLPTCCGTPLSATRTGRRWPRPAAARG